jgi:DNA gyrase subunit A
MTAWTLRGAERLAQAIPAGTTNSAKNPVFLSLVGWLDIANPAVCAEPGKSYDLRPLAGLTVVLATRKGMVKKTRLSEYDSNRQGGIIAINLADDDELISARLVSESDDLIMVSRKGMSARFSADDGTLRPMGRATRGVRGMKLQSRQQVLSLLIADDVKQTVLVATENGYGKRTVLADFRHSGRGTQGVIAIATSARNGKVVAAKLVNDDDEIMLITTGGVLIRTRVKEIRELGRATQGVTLINLGEGEKLSGLEKVVESEEDAA